MAAEWIAADNNAPARSPRDRAIRGRAVQADIEAEGNRSALKWASFGLGLVAVLTALDLWDDMRDAKEAWNLTLHMVLAVVALVIACFLTVRLLRLRRRVYALSERLQLPGPDEERWRAYSSDAIPALRSAIRRQFASWRLTSEEQAVALLLLNGLDPYQIAGVTDEAPRVVQHNVSEIYRKAGLSGRTELTAFFLADLVP